MATSIPGYSTAARLNGFSRVAVVLRRAPLVMATVIFTLISVRYLFNPVRAAAAVGISLLRPAASRSRGSDLPGFLWR